MRKIYLAIAKYCLNAVKDSISVEYELVNVLRRNSMIQAYGRIKDALLKIDAAEIYIDAAYKEEREHYNAKYRNQ